MIAPYEPNTNAKVMDLPAVIPPAAGGADDQFVPSDVRTLPAVPAEVIPVPPLATAKVVDKPAAVPDVFWLNVGHVKVPVLKLPDVGVPSTGVTNDGLVFKTTEPVPVEVVTPVPPLATAKVTDKPPAVPVVFWFSVGMSDA
jgi:hypothetical protein